MAKKLTVKFYKRTASLLLLFNGSGALYGGWSLITHPDGSGIHLSLDWLTHTPFQNYLVPGIILFVANGLFSAIVLLTIFFDRRNYPILIITEGVILTGWIVIQMILIQTVYYLHVILSVVGSALIACGWTLANRQKKKHLK